MATFARGHHARQCHQHNQRELRIGSTTTTQPDTKVRWYLDPADSLTLRGIPAIGKSVQGAMHNTRPDQVDHDKPRNRWLPIKDAPDRDTNQ